MLCTWSSSRKILNVLQVPRMKYEYLYSKHNRPYVFRGRLFRCFTSGCVLSTCMCACVRACVCVCVGKRDLFKRAESGEVSRKAFGSLYLLCTSTSVLTVRKEFLHHQHVVFLAVESHRLHAGSFEDETQRIFGTLEPSVCLSR